MTCRQPLGSIMQLAPALTLVLVFILDSFLGVLGQLKSGTGVPLVKSRARCACHITLAISHSGQSNYSGPI